MVRVLTVGPVPPDWGGRSAGGVATLHKALVSEFLRNDHDIEIAAIFPTNTDDVSDLPRGVRGVTTSIATQHQQEWYGRMVQAVGAEAVLFLHIGHRWAVWHARHPPAPAVGSIQSWHQITFRPSTQVERSRRVLREALAGMNALIFPSKFTLIEGRELGFRYSCPAEVVPNVMAPCFESIENGSERRGIVFVGSLIRRKNPDLVLLGANAVRRPVTLIGDGPLRDMLEDLAASVSVNVEMPGQLPLRRVAERVRDAEILCVPSASESFGIVYVEAGGVGTPSVGFAPTISEISEAAGADIGVGVMEPKEETVRSALRHALGRLWDHDAMASAVSERFCAREIGKQYARVLSRVSGTSGFGA